MPSTVAIDEPAVPASVHAGRDMQSKRRYVLLADMPVEPALDEFDIPLGAIAMAVPAVASAGSG